MLSSLCNLFENRAPLDDMDIEVRSSNELQWLDLTSCRCYSHDSFLKLLSANSNFLSWLHSWQQCGQPIRTWEAMLEKVCPSAGILTGNHVSNTSSRIVAQLWPPIPHSLWQWYHDHQCATWLRQCANNKITALYDTAHACFPNKILHQKNKYIHS